MIVDDDPDAVALTKHALSKAGIPNPVVVKSDGASAIAYLGECAKSGSDALPLLVFLDLKMPGTDGFHVLEWIRTQPNLRRLLTIVQSSSADPEDVNRAFGLGAKSYLQKYIPVSEITSIFELANAMLSVEEVEKFVLPELRRRSNVVDGG